MPYARYLSVANVRAEGLPFSDEATYDADYVNAKIDMASEAIEGFTGNWFSPLTRTIHLDGNGGNFLPIPFPIVAITSITILYATRYGADPEYSVDISEVQVYNRHLTQGLLSPNDRKNPGLSIESYLAYPRENLAVWPEGSQNIKIAGKFGWTELAYNDTVGETEEGSQVPESDGSTPALIKRACMMLVRKYWPKVGDFHGMASVAHAIGDITSMKARDQSVTWSSAKSEGGGGLGITTGDTDVDKMLIGFRRAANMRWA